MGKGGGEAGRGGRGWGGGGRGGPGRKEGYTAAVRARARSGAVGEGGGVAAGAMAAVRRKGSLRLAVPLQVVSSTLSHRRRPEVLVRGGFPEIYFRRSEMSRT